MANSVITKSLKELLLDYLKKHRKADLLTTYFFFLEKKYHIEPVLFIREKTIYQSKAELLKTLEEAGKLWRETEIKIQVGTQSVNEATKKIYICPFTGKVFGDNTHPNPQDAIYDWVSKCPENTERVDGMKVKRFFVSEDPEVIKNYIQKRREPITKIVFSSGVTGKLFGSKKAVIDDFKKNQLKEMELVDVPSQNRFKIEDHFMEFIQEHLDDTKISAFVDAMAKEDAFKTHVERWVEENQ
ncbi:DUF2709 domain-containing protein [Candidatus Neptunochlamydia vexilliferae]|uniref:Uncharacterized protein n=1 Tax=Candidatus Neptunichlamydia vexilliferae TaxID=1651774 RepID=A0ABS0AX73_9BACT|nr:DUF2709 domain-containing protein [Candidatus Neptunochlamydia vexilliferae]MBF5058728.1 hypothetical protein [Candidatus Neptunochlamydia vexilliferae]